MENVQELLELMARLREPKAGCPWDLRQDFKSLAPFCLEEAYEVVDAIEREDGKNLLEELGDLLFQVVFLARIAEERGFFDFATVVEDLKSKIISRHPHVFENQVFASETELKAFWESSKEKERNDRDAPQKRGLLASIPKGLPSLSRAQKIQQRVARVGFDWPSIGPVYSKLEEELLELRAAATQGDIRHLEEEMGDVLFSMVNLARHHGIDAESALRRSNDKFARRFEQIETRAANEERVLADLNAEELDTLWEEAKDLERVRCS